MISNENKKRIKCMTMRAGLAVSAFMMGTGTASAYAATTTPAPNGGIMTDIEKITGGSSDGVFSKLENTVWDVSSSGYSLVKTICLAGLLLSVLFTGLTLALTKNSSKRDESKSKLVYIGLGAILIFGAGAIISLVSSIGSSISV